MAQALDVAAELRASVPSSCGVVKLQKLLYYCQAWHFTWTGEPLFPEAIEAWDNGPVVADLWRDEKYGINQRPPQTLGDIELRTIHYVVNRYGRLYGADLIDLTHKEEPWREAYYEGGRNTVISLDRIRDFFSEDPAVDQAWFWEPEWQAGESEADDDIRRGRMSEVMSEDEFLASL